LTLRLISSNIYFKREKTGLFYCIFLFAAQVQATYVTIYIEAEVDYAWSTGDFLVGKIDVGDTLTGWYTFDSETADTNPSEYVGDYYHYSSPAGITLSGGGFTFQTDPEDVEFLVETYNGEITDNYLLRSENNLPLSNGWPVYSISWQLDDDTATVLSDDSLPLTPPVLSDWQDGNILDITGTTGCGSPEGFNIRAHVISAVPEPASVLLLSFGIVLMKIKK